MTGFHEQNKNGFCYLTSELFESAGVRHLFSTRYGGVSSGPFSSMNLGLNRGDEREKVLENFSIAASALSASIEDYVLSAQVHEDKILCITGEDRGRGITKPSFDNADGLLTDEPGVLLCIFTADCVPLLFYDKKKKVIGAVHAGWRGTVKNIAGKAVFKMAERYKSNPEDIIAAIGPAIGKCHFEIGADVAVELTKADFCRNHVFDGKPGKYMADLPAMNAEALTLAGVPQENIAFSGECTCCKSDKYFSHRITGGVRGSLASMLIL